MKTIYKYEIPIKSEFKIDLPEGAEILKVDDQRGMACIWALVNTDHIKVERRFTNKGTGHEIRNDEYLKHIGSFFQGVFVWHLFEKF